MRFMSTLFRGTTKLTSTKIMTDIDDLVLTAKRLLKSNRENDWEIGKIVAQAKALGYSVRQFAPMVDYSHTYLNHALKLYQQYSSAELVPTNLSLEDIVESQLSTVDTETEKRLRLLRSALFRWIRQHDVDKAMATA